MNPARVQNPFFSAVIPVGPSEIELERTADLLDSLACYEPGGSSVILIDDAPEERNLRQVFPDRPAFQITSLYNDRAGLGIGSTSGLSAGMLKALGWISEHQPPEFIVKLDTDALVIAPFADKLRALFADDPAIGMAGLFETATDGQPRDHLTFKRIVTKLRAPFAIWKRPVTPLGIVTLHFTGRRAIIRRHIREAMAGGYEPGEFILGGAYACSGEMIRRVSAAGYLRDPKLWLLTHMSEDAVLSLYARAVKLKLKGFAKPGEVFGVTYIGLPCSPRELVENRYSIIHSTKWDSQYPEDQIRGFFRARRTGLAGLESADRTI